MSFKFLLLFFLLPLQAFAEQKQALFHELKFVPETLKKSNTVELIDPNQTKTDYVFVYEINRCYPLKLVEREGYKFYYREADYFIDYISSVSPIYRETNMALNVNGLHISGTNLRFTMRNDCKELVPIHFISMKAQNYLGFPLKQGSIVKYNVGQENTDKTSRGPINEDGYVAPIDINKSNKELHDRYKNYQNAVKDFDYAVGCLEVKESQKSKDGFYIYQGKKIDFSVGHPKFWLANSKYVGHRVCSDQPNAIFDCVGTIIGGYDYEREVFGIGGAYFEEGISLGEKAKIQAEYEKNWNKAKILGKKCDEAIAKYEKETGKKVKISPYYPKELLKK